MSFNVIQPTAFISQDNSNDNSNSSHEEGLPEKKKRRVPLSCVSCRKRKIKCNRAKPACDKCVKSKIPCAYDGPEDWNPQFVTQQSTQTTPKSSTSTSTPRSSFQSSNFPIGIVPSKSASTVVSNHRASDGFSGDGFGFINNAHSSSLDFQSSFSVVPHQTHDKIKELEILKARILTLENEIKASTPDLDDTISLNISPIENKIANYIFFKKNRFMVLGTFQRTVLWLRDPIMAKVPELFNLVRIKADGKSRGQKDQRPQSDTPVTRVIKEQIEKRKKGNNSKINPIPHSDELNVLNLESLAQLLVENIPSEKTVRLYLDRFFELIYPFVPIFDEAELRSRVFDILSYEDGKAFVKFNKEKTNFITISSLLLICRLSYISFIITDQTYSMGLAASASLDGNSENIITEVDPKITKLVNFVVHRFNCLRKSSIDVLQLIMILRFYQTVAPEDSDGSSGEDGLIFNDFVATTGILVGLNYDWGSLSGYQPKMFKEDAEHDIKFKNLWKKLWSYLCDLDLEFAANYGRIPAVNQAESNQSPPHYDEQGRNVDNINIERFVVWRINKSRPIYDTMCDLLISLHSIANPPKISEVELKLKTLVRLKKERYSNRRDKRKLEFTDDLNNLLNINCFEASLHYYILLKYEISKNYELYTDKFMTLLSLTLESFLAIFEAVQLSTNELSNYAIFLIHRYIYSSLKFFHFLLYFTTRVMVIRQSANGTRHSFLTTVIENFVTIMKAITKLHGLLADKYYTSLRIYGLLNYLTECFSNDKKVWLNIAIKRDLRYHEDILMNRFTQDQLNEINERLCFMLNDPIFKRFNDDSFIIWNQNLSSDSLLMGIKQCSMNPNNSLNNNSTINQPFAGPEGETAGMGDTATSSSATAAAISSAFPMDNFFPREQIDPAFFNDPSLYIFSDLWDDFEL